MNSKPLIVFFGTGPVAARSLELLLENFTVEAVITKPKPPHHRGDFPVLDIARSNELKVYEVTDKQSLSELFNMAQFKSKVGVLIDFGIIVAQDVIDYFPKGIVNSHFSLLPEWRGADPITFSILSGQKRTGVSLMLINDKLDEGLLLSQAPVEVSESDTTATLTDTLITESALSLKKVLPLWLDSKTDPARQEEVTMAERNTPTYSRKLTKEDSLLDWNKPSEQLEREIRAFVDWPKSRATLGGVDVIVTNAHVAPNTPPNAKPGDIILVEEASEIGVVTASGTLWIDRLKPAGKKEMTANEFIRGYKNRL